MLAFICQVFIQSTTMGNDGNHSLSDTSDESLNRARRGVGASNPDDNPNIDSIFAADTSASDAALVASSQSHLTMTSTPDVVLGASFQSGGVAGVTQASRSILSLFDWSTTVVGTHALSGDVAGVTQASGP